MASFGLSEIQAKAILDLQLQRLTALEREKILEELEEIRKKIQELEEILASERKIKSVIINELRDVQKAFEDKYLFMVTRKGVIKKCALSEFDNPMARGIIAVSLDEGDELIGVGETTGDKFIFLGTH